VRWIIPFADGLIPATNEEKIMETRRRKFPSLMVILSMTLKAGVNRWLNIIVAVLYIAVGVGTTIGETWAFYIVGHFVGIVLLLIVIWTALKWPKQEA
jgi:hypothetical protein